MSWNLDLLRSCVSEEEVKAIEGIPISILRIMDKPIWIHNKSRKYLVKSDYVLACEVVAESKREQPSSSHSHIP